MYFGEAVDRWSRYRDTGHSFATDSVADLSSWRKECKWMYKGSQRRNGKMRMTEEDGVKWAVTFFVDCEHSGCFYRAFMARVIREIQVSKAGKLLPRYCIYYMFPSFFFLSFFLPLFSFTSRSRILPTLYAPTSSVAWSLYSRRTPSSLRRLELVLSPFFKLI